MTHFYLSDIIVGSCHITACEKASCKDPSAFLSLAKLPKYWVAASKHSSQAIYSKTKTCPLPSKYSSFEISAPLKCLCSNKPDFKAILHLNLFLILKLRVGIAKNLLLNLYIKLLIPKKYTPILLARYIFIYL